VRGFRPKERAVSDQPTVAADPEIEHVVTAWDEALGAKDLEAAMALYHEDCVLESPLVCHLLGTERGVVEGRAALRAFVEQVFAHQPPERGRHRTGILTDGERVIWEYPRERPDGEQMDFAEVMEIRDGRIARHRVYWGWKGVGMLVRGEHGR
jgi:ketosteroid isomerase-like protein